MKGPSKQNYMIWLVDLKDGILSDSDYNLLMTFLDQHPTIKAEAELFLAPLEADQEPIEMKNHIPNNQHKPFESTFKMNPLPDFISETFMARCLEGDITAQEQKDWELALQQNRALQREWKYFQSTRFKAPMHVNYQYKASLYKNQAALKWRFLSPMRVAAAVFICMVAGLFLRWHPFGSDPNKNTQKQVANTDSTAQMNASLRFVERNTHSEKRDTTWFNSYSEKRDTTWFNSYVLSAEENNAAEPGEIKEKVSGITVVAHEPLAIYKPQALQGTQDLFVENELLAWTQDEMYTMPDIFLFEFESEEDKTVNIDQPTLTRREVRHRNYRFVRNRAGALLERYSGIQKQETDTRIVYKMGFVTYNKSKQ